MGLIHIPRTLASVARGAFRSFKKKNKNQGTVITPPVGLSPSKPHIYTARVGLLDVDIIGHMNNAAYLNHAEFAKYEMTAESGILFPLLQHRCAYIVTSSVIRYRREMHPIFRKFQVHTHVPAVDDKHIWMYHTFRYASSSDEVFNKIRAQVLIKAVLWVDRKVMDPRVFLKEKCQVDPSILQQLDRSGEFMLMEEEMDRFDALEESLRVSASRDDEQQ